MHYKTTYGRDRSTVLVASANRDTPCVRCKSINSLSFPIDQPMGPVKVRLVELQHTVISPGECCILREISDNIVKQCYICHGWQGIK